METLYQSGRMLFAVSMMAYAAIIIITGNFPSALLPVPEFSGRIVAVYSTAVIVVVCGVLILINKGTARAAGILGMLFTTLLIVAHIPKLVVNPRDGSEWAGASEVMAFCGGAFFLMSVTRPSITQPAYHTIYKTGAFGKYLLAAALAIFGVQHFMYATFVSSLIPAWIPGQPYWPYFTGTAFLAASLSIITYVQVKLAMSLLGVMFLLWILLLHIPRVITNPSVETEWTSTIVPMTMAGIAFFLARPAAKANKTI